MCDSIIADSNRNSLFFNSLKIYPSGKPFTCDHRVWIASDAHCVLRGDGSDGSAVIILKDETIVAPRCENSLNCDKVVKA